MEKKLVLLVVLLIILFMLKPVEALFKTILLVSQEFPQVSIKPLHSITKKPKVEKVELLNGENKIVADLFLPQSRSKKPAIIVAMGARTNEKDRPIILGFSDTLARLGYVVLWPRLEALDKDIAKVEEPQTFVEAFKYLEERSEVDKERISFAGFSVGSSIAMVAAQDPKINQQVQSLVFFGGYYNIIDYLTSLATQTIFVDNKKVNWQPADGAISYTKEALEKEGLKLEQFTDGKPFDQKIEKLLRYSPDQKLEDFKASTFILHEKGDSFVPFVESIKLKSALEAKGRPLLAFHLANLFEHVQPKKGLSTQVLGEFLGIFGFLYKIFMYI